LHMLTFVAAADIESASPPMMLFFCFVLFCTCSCKAPPPPLDQSLVLLPPSLPVDQEHWARKKAGQTHKHTNNHPIYYCCIFLLLLLLLGSLSTTDSPIHAFQASRISAVPFVFVLGFM
jgi:hypothetical protein